MDRKINFFLSPSNYRFVQSVYDRWIKRYASGITEAMPFAEFCGLALVAACEDMEEMFKTDLMNKEEN